MLPRLNAKAWLFPGLIATIFFGPCAWSQDELTVQLSRNGAPVSGMSIVLDGEEEHQTAQSGLAFFDLKPGQHSVQIVQAGNPVHTFRFTSSRDQLADINVDLSDPDSPRVGIETYVETETAEQLVQAATGVVRGQVTGAGVPVEGALVRLIDGITRQTQTDASGRFELEAPRGIYRLSVTSTDNGSRDISDFRIIANAIIGSDIVLEQGAAVTSAAGPMEEVMVVGSINVGGGQTTERFATEIVDVLDHEQIIRFGDTDIAASVLRVPAVTVQQGKFVFVRGLGGRYISTSLNGASMPSTDPTKRTVPLDLFPTSMIDQIDVGKTFIAPISGESTGGNIRITTRTFPTESDGSFSVSLGYTNGLTGEDVWTDPEAGDWDFVGVDDGSRKRPVIAWSVAEALRAQRSHTDFDIYDESVRQQLGRIGAMSIVDGLNLEKTTASPDLSLNVSYGDLRSLDNLDSDFGFFVAGSLKNEWKQRDEGIRRTYGGVNASQVLDDYTLVRHDNNVDVHGLLALGFNRNQSTYKSNTILTRSTGQSVQRNEGIDGDELDPSINWSIEWEERQYISQQILGNHILGDDAQWSIDWQGTISQAWRYAPDRRDVRFDLLGDDGIYDLQSAEVVRRYDDLTDDNLDVSTDLEYLFLDSATEAKLQFGAQAIVRERDSDSTSFGFQGGLLGVDTNSPTLNVNDIINENTITGDSTTGFDFIDKTLSSDSYEAEMTLNSLYVSYDALFNDRYQLVVGVRAEDYEQTTETFSLQGEQEPVRSLLEETSTLPALTLNWFTGGDQQIRFSASKTVARPDFKETSNATFYDREFNFRVRGNPNLKVSDITNYDIRWEKYFSGQESVSIALFYKDLENPIERVVQPASGTAGNSRTFQNADSAEIKGLEVDVRKDFALNESFTRSLYMAVNASNIDSKVTLIGGETRALQGAPEYSINLILGYDDISHGQEFTILLNQSGDTIVDVGVSGQPDIIQQPRLDIDLNYKYYINESLTFKLKIEDLLDSEYEFTQGGQIFQQYKTGQRFQAGVDWSF